MILSDPSERTQEAHEVSSLRKHLQQLSRYDQDTGFPNHEALLSDINAEIANVGPRPLGATFIEIRIKGLSRIGEAYGRKTIGSVIRQLAERLERAPIQNRIIGRIDHKSFGIFLYDVSDPVLALQTAKQLVALCSRPVPWGDHMLNIEAIAGVALTTEAVGRVIKMIKKIAGQKDRRDPKGQSHDVPVGDEAALALITLVQPLQRFVHGADERRDLARHMLLAQSPAPPVRVDLLGFLRDPENAGQRSRK